MTLTYQNFASVSTGQYQLYPKQGGTPDPAGNTGCRENSFELEGKITGYLEYKTRSHKTARLVQRQGLSMPLVAPVRGVGKTPWVLEFIKVAKLADRPLYTLHNVPLLPAPTEERIWTNRSTSAQEAKKWLLSVLSRSLDKEPEMTTIHCLKSTALSWAGSWTECRDKTSLGTSQHWETLSRNL